MADEYSWDEDEGEQESAAPVAAAPEIKDTAPDLLPDNIPVVPAQRSDLKGVGPKGMEVLKNKGYKQGPIGDPNRNEDEAPEFLPDSIPVIEDQGAPSQKGFFKNVAQGAQASFASGVETGIKGGMDILHPTQDNSASKAYKLADDLKAALAPDQSEADKQTWGSTIGNVIGGIGAIAAPFLAGPEVGIPAMIAQGAAQAAHAGHESAITAGNTDAGSVLATEGAAAIGGVSSYLMGNISKFLPAVEKIGNVAVTGILQRALQAGQEGLAFGGLGVADRAAQEYLEHVATDPNAEGHQDWKSFITDMATGVVFGLMHGGAKPAQEKPPGLPPAANTGHSPSSNLQTLGNSPDAARPEGVTDSRTPEVWPKPPPPGSPPPVSPKAPVDASAINADQTVLSVLGDANAKAPKEPAVAAPSEKVPQPEEIAQPQTPDDQFQQQQQTEPPPSGPRPENGMAMQNAPSADQRAMLTEIARQAEQRNAAHREANQQREAAQQQEIAAPATHTLYHGSPHKVEEFSNDKIGTGEGHAAYGYGHYVGEAEGTGERYAQALGRRARGVMVDGTYHNEDSPEAQAASIVHRWHDEPTKEDFVKTLKALSSGEQADILQPVIKVLEKWTEGALPKLRLGNGKLYKIEAHLDHDKMIHWDRPLKDQPEVLKALTAMREKYGPTSERPSAFLDARGNPVSWPWQDLTGAEYLRQMHDQVGKKRAAEMLHEHGIEGIRYLDEGSRNVLSLEGQLAEEKRILRDMNARGASEVNLQGQADIVAEYEKRIEKMKVTHNLVVFDPKKLKIQEQYQKAENVEAKGSNKRTGPVRYPGEAGMERVMVKKSGTGALVEVNGFPLTPRDAFKFWEDSFAGKNPRMEAKEGRVKRWEDEGGFHGDMASVREDLIRHAEENGTKVFVLDKGGIAKIGMNKGGAGAWFDPRYNHLILRSESGHEVGASGGKYMQERVIYHEMEHAGFSHKMEDNPHIKAQTREIRDEVIAELRKTKAGLEKIAEFDYGLGIDAAARRWAEHEFHAEARSNGGFQKMLSEIKVSDALAMKLGMNDVKDFVGKPWYSMWDAIVNMSRKALGLRPDQFTALEAIMKVREDLAQRPHTPERLAEKAENARQEKYAVSDALGPKGSATLQRLNKMQNESAPEPKKEAPKPEPKPEPKKEEAPKKDDIADLEGHEGETDLERDMREEHERILKKEFDEAADKMKKAMEDFGKEEPKPEEPKPEEPKPEAPKDKEYKPEEPPKKPPPGAETPPPEPPPAGRLKTLKGPIAHWLRQTSSLIRSFHQLGHEIAGHRHWQQFMNFMFEHKAIARRHMEELSPVLKQGVELSKKLGGAASDKLALYMEKATKAGLTGHKSLDEQMTKKEQAKKKNFWRADMHPELEKLWNDLHPEQQKWLMEKWYPATEKTLEKSAIQRMTNFMDKLKLGLDHKAIAERLWKGYGENEKQEQADKDALGKHYEAIKAMADRSRKPWYTPLNNGSGYYTLAARLKPVLKGGERDVSKEVDADWQVGDRRTFAFDTEKEARDFGNQQTLEPTHGERIIDPTQEGKRRTGSYDAEGKWHKYEEGDMEENENLKKEHLVQVRNQHYSEHATEHERNTHATKMKDSGLYEEGSLDMGVKKWRAPLDPKLLGREFERAIKNLKDSDSYKAMSPEEKIDAERAMTHAWQEMLASTANPHMERTGAAGANRSDLNANLYHWAQRSAHEQASAEIAPKIDETLKKMEDVTKNGYDVEGYKETENQRREKQGAREEMTNTLMRRWQDAREMGADDTPPALRNLLTLSYLKHLATPAFALRNITQYPLYTMMEQAARYGMAKTTRVAWQAVGDIGVKNLLKEAGRGFKYAATGRGERANFSKMLLEGTKFRSEGERQAFEEAVRTGLIDDAVMLPIDQIGGKQARTNVDILKDREKSKLRDVLNKTGDISKDTMAYVEEFSRILPSVSEAFNRGMTALTEYRLAHGETGNHAKTMERVHDQMNSTQVRYDKSDLPAWQRSAWATPFVQFKRFGGAMYNLYGGHIGNLIMAHPEGTESRATAAKALGYLTVSGLMAAGMAGLPLEPVGMMLSGARQVGLTQKDMDWVVGQMHETVYKVAKELGVDPHTAAGFAKVMTFGLPHLIGIDLNQGLGLQNAIGGFGPRAGAERDLNDNLFAYLGKQIFGSVGGMAVDATTALRELKSDPIDAMKKSPLPKIMSDIAGTIHDREGKKDARGRQYAAAPSAYENIMKVIGFPLSSDTEQGARHRYIQGIASRDKSDRAQLITNWMNSEGEAKKEAARAAIAGGLSTKDLMGAASRKLRQPNVNGEPVSKRLQPQLREKANAFAVPPVK